MAIHSEQRRSVVAQVANVAEAERIIVALQVHGIMAARGAADLAYPLLGGTQGITVSVDAADEEEARALLRALGLVK